MSQLQTTYMGLGLHSPIIAGASDVTYNLDYLKRIEDSGAGAVVIRSLFEEEIIMEMEEMMHEMISRPYVFPETHDYMEDAHEEDTVRSYLSFIEKAKKAVDIPVIASINCISDQKWTYLAREIERSGADGLELNMFVLPSDFNKTAKENEALYFEVVKKIKEQVSIPVAMKISHYFSHLGSFIKKLSETELDAIVLFNRYYSPDIDLDKMKITSSKVLSNPNDLTLPLRWVALMANRVSCDLGASTGVHDGNAAIKQLLAGATTVQMASALYLHGPEYIKTVHDEIEQWMDKNHYDHIDKIRGRLSYDKASNPADYERVQFIKNFRNYVMQR